MSIVYSWKHIVSNWLRTTMCYPLNIIRSHWKYRQKLWILQCISEWTRTRAVNTARDTRSSMGETRRWLVWISEQELSRNSWLLFVHILSLFNLSFFHIFHNFSLFNLLFFHIFHIFPQFNWLFCHNFHIIQSLTQHEIPDRPWEKPGVDLFEFRNKNYLVTVDYYSSFFEVDRLYKTTSKHVIQKWRSQFSKHGIPSKGTTMCYPLNIIRSWKVSSSRNV
jgi:hypothetical protein